MTAPYTPPDVLMRLGVEAGAASVFVTLRDGTITVYHGSAFNIPANPTVLKQFPRAMPGAWERFFDVLATTPTTEGKEVAAKWTEQDKLRELARDVVKAKTAFWDKLREFEIATCSPTEETQTWADRTNDLVYEEIDGLATGNVDEADDTDLDRLVQAAMSDRK